MSWKIKAFYWKGYGSADEPWGWQGPTAESTYDQRTANHLRDHVCGCVGNQLKKSSNEIDNKLMAEILCSIEKIKERLDKLEKRN